MTDSQLGRRSRWRAHAPGLAILALTLILVGIAQTSAGKTAAGHVGVYSPAERYTELYFAEPGQIALETRYSTADPGRVRVHFAIVNRTGARRRYIWATRGGTRYGPGGSIVVGTSRPGFVTTHVRTPCRQRTVSVRRRVTTRTVHVTHRVVRGRKVLVRKRVTRRTFVTVRQIVPGPHRALIMVAVRPATGLRRPAETISYWLLCHA